MASGPRLLFLWPMLWKPATEATSAAARSTHAARRMRAYHPSPRRQQTNVTQRYGTANEPPPHLGGGKGLGPPSTQQAKKQPKALAKIGENLQRDGEREIEASQNKGKGAPGSNTEAATSDTRLASDMSSQPLLDAAKEMPIHEPPGSPRTLDDKPLESVLEAVPAPVHRAKETSSEAINAEVEEAMPQSTAPHIDAPRYVHHFDTYGLVKHLAEGGWNEAQAITIMKAVRLMLADSTDLADSALVSKSNLENQSYLFKAACAELRTEVMSRRKTELEKMRTERTQLQHEVDILSQRLGQESTNLKDELKGLFDGRKMAVRNEQREMESKIQQLNQRITVRLQADARSEVEGLRWVMTRRVIITLATVVLMVVGSLKLYSDAAHEAEEARKRGGQRRIGGQDGIAEGNDARTAFVGGGELVVKEGDNPTFVSLG